MEPNFYKEELYQMRKSYESDPLKDISLRRPFWMEPTDPLAELYSEKATLLKKGRIVFASIVQANTLLFKRFPPLNCPAHIVYSTDDHVSEDPDILRDTAFALYSLKGKDAAEVPERWREISKVITDEYDRSGFTFAAESDGSGFEYCLIPTMIHRKLLPKGKLCGMILPVLVHPDCKQVIVLPKKYWTENFKKEWILGNV